MPEPTREKDKDKGSKWLIEHHGDAILRLGGVTDLVRWQAAAAELVLPGKLPDGLLLAWRAGRDRPEAYIVEIATYSDQRTAEQALRNMLLVYLIRGEIPNVLVVVLRPKGRVRVADGARRAGSDGVTELACRWRVVELWTLPAEPVLASDLGRRIAMEDVLDVLRPLLLREYAARRSHKDILKFLTIRFGVVPPALEAEVKAILDESVLDTVVGLAASCANLEQFQAEMRAIPRPPEPWDPADEPDPEPDPKPFGTG
jgi:hypothetical protein